MENYIIIAVVVLIVVFAGLYIYKAKKSGKKCIGCPDGGSCGSNKEGGCSSCSCCCGCSEDEHED